MQWETVDRAIKILGVIGGLVAAGGVYSQLRNSNLATQQQAIEAWQNTAVYKIIEENKLPISLRDIIPKYAAESNNFPTEIPHGALDEEHLRLTIIRLIQGGTIAEVDSGVYAVRNNQYDPKDVAEVTLKAQNDYNRLSAAHMLLIARVLREAKNPLSSDEIKELATERGGDRAFLEQNFFWLIQQMNSSGEVFFAKDGRIASRYTANIGLANTITLKPSPVIPEPAIASILPRMDADILASVLFENGTFHECSKEPNELIEKMEKINLLKINNENKNDVRCNHLTVTAPTKLFFKVKNFYIRVLFEKLDENYRIPSGVTGMSPVP